MFFPYKHLLGVLSIVGLCCSGKWLITDLPADPDVGKYKLVWSDEFDGSELDESSWNYEIGDGCPKICGWGNKQKQYYTRENTEVREGKLIITAREEEKGGYDYTSSRIQSAGKREFRFGRIDIRAKMPIGKGMWPALWMLGASRYDIGWPKCGEIDILELAGNQPSLAQGTVHYQGRKWRKLNKAYYELEEGTFADDFHIYSLDWEKDRMAWLVDDLKYYEITRDSVDSDRYPFNDPFYFIINLAVGGSWRAGNPDSTTVFPQTLEVDYIRVYQKEENENSE